MKKYNRIFLIVILVLVVLYKGVEWWVEYRLEVLINRNPDRAYNIEYANMDLHVLFKGVTLEEMKIVPVRIDSGTVIRGSVEYAKLDGLVWIDLFAGRKLNIGQIIFQKPVFNIKLSNDTVKKSSGKGLQELFGDILSRGKLRRFEIKNGGIVLLEPHDKSIVGELSNLNLVANELKTDSLQWKNLIPFELGSFQASIDSLYWDINAYTKVSTGRMEYRMRDKRFRIENLNMAYTEDWKMVSKKIGKQKDLMEVMLREIAFEQLEASSSFYSELDILAKKIVLEDLVFKDYRDKNMVRPSDVIKPMFKGMVDAIPFELKVDSIVLKNAEVWYSELGKNKTEAGTVRFESINGFVTNLTTIDELQDSYKNFKATFDASLNGIAPVSFNLKVPYNKEAFYAEVRIGKMDLVNMNQTTRTLAGVEIVSGNSDRIYFEMNASDKTSENKMFFDYRDLKLNLLKENKEHQLKNKPLVSAIANSAIRHHNIPDEGKYLQASYYTERNPYRGPFNYMWLGVMDGMMHIVPGKSVQKVLGLEKKGKKEKNAKKKK
ncbi:hypothetical protein LCM02_12670 [Lutimonas saemankumensis]|uniref:hypothetical protein n=1 Tax=Lutimonas saemankumensis TaxID=483016 RepID=UPI001CD2431A|nr:hypothetical protein [Lutimonas saemankumensis]MCA0933308.1 hypothetical protein [Lutimonas saemankumensis]